MKQAQDYDGGCAYDEKPWEFSMLTSYSRENACYQVRMAVALLNM